MRRAMVVLMALALLVGACGDEADEGCYMASGTWTHNCTVKESTCAGMPVGRTWSVQENVDPLEFECGTYTKNNTTNEAATGCTLVETEYRNVTKAGCATNGVGTVTCPGQAPCQISYGCTGSH